MNKIWLASYPRSGNTLLRTILNHCFNLKSASFYFSDFKGNIIFFSLDESKILDKFNFYKKKYKNLKKTINMIVEENIIYVSDNFGYL